MAADEQLGLQIVTEGMQKFLGDMKTADGAVGKTASGWEKAGGAIGKVAGVAFNAIAIGATAAAAAIGIVGGAIVKLTLDAVPLKGVSDAFEGIANTTTLGSEKMMAALQAGSYGMVSQIDLMKSFNSAAQLVSVDFAEKLPDAMGYMAKVSAATGQDMNYMVDSLVKGVGRLSPMILDNLGIQVSLSEATENAAEMFGVEASELTKAQTQAGMMNVVLEKLAANTAAMPEVTGSAAQQMAALKAQIQDTKDQIGMAFIPILQQVLTPLLSLAERVLPAVVQGFENFAEIIGFFTSYIKFAREGGDWLNDWLAELPAFIQPVAQLIGGLAVAFDTFRFALGVGVAPLDALKLALQTTFGEDVAAQAMGFIDGIKNGLETLRPFVEAAIPAFQALGAFIIQVFNDIAAFALPLIESIAAFFVEKVGFIVAWAQENLPLMQATFETTLATIKAIWDAVWPAIQLVVTSVWTVIQAVITVALQIITALITTVMQAIQGDWEGAWQTIQTAAAAIWDTITSAFNTFISGVLTAMGTSMAEFTAVWKSNWDMAVTIVTTIWESIKTAVSTAWDGIVTFVKTGITQVKEAISSQIASFKTLGGEIIGGILAGISGSASQLAGAVRNAVQGALNAAKAALGIQSPSTVFREQVGRNISAGIAAGIGDLAPQISAQVQAVTAPGGRGVSTSNTSVTNNFNLTTNSLTRPGGLALEFATMGMGSR